MALPEIQTIAVAIGATSASRNTALTPTAGRKVRIISVAISAKVTTAPDKVGVYFGTGAAYLTNASTAIGEYFIGTTGNASQSWPDGRGPVGAADAVVSWIAETETETGMNLTIVYYEESGELP